MQEKGYYRPDQRGWSITMALSFLASVALLLELYFSASGKSLCPTSACEIVGEYVRFGEPILLASGACFFLILTCAVFFSGRYSSSIVALMPLVLLIGAAAFDGALLGFQFMTLNQRCLICIAVACAIGTVSFSYGLAFRKRRVFCLCLIVWGAGFLANSLLVMPEITTASSGMVFYERKAGQQFVKVPTSTFIFSMECPHCNDVLEYLAGKNPRDMRWRMAIVDREKESVNKLGHFYANAAQDENPFRLLLEAKKNHAQLPEDVVGYFGDQARQARVFLSNNDLKSIPVLVVDEEKGRKIILSGADKIIEYFKAREGDTSQKRM